MTANFIAQVVENKLNAIDLSAKNLNSLYDYNKALTMLEFYIMRHFLTFEMTEKVYTHAKKLCEKRIKFENWYRVSSWCKDRISAYNEFGGNINCLQSAKGSRCCGF